MSAFNTALSWRSRIRSSLKDPAGEAETAAGGAELLPSQMAGGVERKSSSVLLLSAVVDLVLTVAAGPSSLIRPPPGQGTRSGRSTAVVAAAWGISVCAFDGEDMTEATAAVTRLSGERGVAAPLTGWLFAELCDTVTGYCTGVEAPETHGEETGLAGEAGMEAQEYQRRAVTVTKPPCACGAECLGRRPPDMACE